MDDRTGRTPDALVAFERGFRRGLMEGLAGSASASAEVQLREAVRPLRREAQEGLNTGPLLVGQVVTYRQGRGAFTAKVVEVSEDGRLVTLKRSSDGKTISRPAGKVFPRT